MRLKLIAGNLVVVLLVGLGSYLVVRTQLRSELSRRLEDRIGDDSELFARSWRADGARLAEGVGSRASSSSVRNVFTALGEANQRRRAFEAAQDEAAAVAERVGVDDVDRVDPCGQHLQRNDRFEASERRAETEVDAVTERDVAVEPFAVGVERFGVVEDAVVVVG